MCEYLSFVVAENGDIHVGHGWSHSGVAKAAKLPPGTYREAEWTAELEVRLQVGDDRVAWYERARRRWQSREALEAYLRGRGVGHSCPNETGEVVEWDISDLPRVALITDSVGGNLYPYGCSGLTSLPEGLSVGGNLYLDGCSGLTSLPEGLSVGGYLDLDGCSGLTSLPEGLSVGGNLYLDGCSGDVIAQARKRFGRRVR
jgi:hypothetical protein